MSETSNFVEQQSYATKLFDFVVACVTWALQRTSAYLSNTDPDLLNEWIQVWVQSDWQTATSSCWYKDERCTGTREQATASHTRLNTCRSTISETKRRHELEIWYDTNTESLTLWHPLMPYGYSYKASCARPGEAVICNFWHPGSLTVSFKCHSARMSKITNDKLNDAL